MASSKVDVQTEYLVFGYIRNLKIITQIVPSSIMLLCLKFYFAKLRIINLQTASLQSTHPPLITVAVLEENKSYQCVMKSIPRSSAPNRQIYDRGVVYLKDIELPANALSIDKTLLKEAVYDVVFVTGSGTSNAYIIDTSQFDIKDKIDVYHWQLPKPNISGGGQRSVYSKKRNILLEIGGYHSNDIEILSLSKDFLDKDTSTVDKWEWKALTKMMYARAHVAVSFMDNDNKLIVASGYKHGTAVNGYLNNAEIYDFNNDQWTEIASMNQHRCRAGMYVDKDANNGVYVGGGKVTSSAGTKKFEYYDHVKNEWILLAETNNVHGRAPIMWKDDVNVIYIASTYGSSIERMDLRQSKWSIFKNTDSFETLFGPKSTKYTQLCFR